MPMEQIVFGDLSGSRLLGSSFDFHADPLWQHLDAIFIEHSFLFLMGLLFLLRRFLFNWADTNTFSTLVR